MKKLFYLFFILLMLPFIGCRHQVGPTTLILQQAEDCMETNPENALQLLKSISRATSLRGQDQADYAMLYTQACDRCRILGTNDSLIRIATEYYKDEENNLNAAKSFFYLGTIYRNAKSNVASIDAYLKALRKMPPEPVNKTLALIHYYLGEAYYEHKLYKDALASYAQCHDTYLAIKDTIGTFYPLRGVAECYLLQEQADSAIYYFQQALSVATQYEQEVWIPHILGDLAKTYLYQKNDIDSGFLYATLSIQRDSLDFVLSTLADAYEQKGKPDSARECLLISKNNPDIYTKANSFYSLYRIEKKMNQYQQACVYADSFILYWDSINALKSYEQARSLNLNYLFEKKEQQLKQQEYIHYYIISGLFLILLLFIFTIYEYYKRKKKEWELEQQRQKFNIQIENINEYIGEQFGEPTPIQISVEQYQKRKLQKSIALFNQTEWKEKLETLTPEQERQKYMRMDEQLELYKALDTIFADYIYNLRKQYPKMNEGDIYFCILSILKYKSRTISYCTHLSLDALRSRKSRLRKSLSTDDFELAFNF